MQQVRESVTLEPANNRSGYKHVKKYTAMLKEKGRLLDLGLFDLPAAAVAESNKPRDSGMARGSSMSKKRGRAAVRAPIVHCQTSLATCLRSLKSTTSMAMPA